jgi:hypothetical protein
MGVMIFIYPPSIFPDASHGFQVMRSMQMGGGFNQLVSPDQDDISKNTSQFLTWWSPGQYLVPYVIKSIFSINTGHATAIVISLCEWSGLLGLYLFFKKIGFTPIIAAVSIIFIACQQAFITPYVFYNGGEILLFGFEGWFLYGCIAINKADLKLLLFVLLSGWIGFFCKSSFMWIYAAGLLCLWLRLSAKNGSVTLPRLFKNGIWLAIPAVISLACIYIFFLSKGDNPAAASKGLDLSWQTFSFPLGSPLLSGFSVDDLMHGMLFPTFTPFLTPVHALIILVLMAVFSVVLIACIIKYVPKNNYRLFVMVFYFVSVCFFSVAYLRQLTISYEARHYRIIGLLLAPGIVYLISKFKPGFQIAFGIALAILAVANYSFFVKGYIFNKNISARGSSGMAQEFIDQPALNYMMQLDKQNNNAVFVFVSADISLEILHNRIITIDPPPKDAIFDNDDYSYAGHAGPLYILLPSNHSDRANMFMKFFPDYQSFSQQKLGTKYILYSAK